MNKIFERYDRVECINDEFGVRTGDTGTVYDLDREEKMVAVIPDGLDSWHWFDAANFKRIIKGERR